MVAHRTITLSLCELSDERCHDELRGIYPFTARIFSMYNFDRSHMDILWMDVDNTCKAANLSEDIIKCNTVLSHTDEGVR